MTVVDLPTVEGQPCGCKTTSYPVLSPGSHTGPNPLIKFEPCLAHALRDAGESLRQAGLRLEEAASQEREDMEDRAEAMRVQAEDFIGGSD